MFRLAALWLAVAATACFSGLSETNLDSDLSDSCPTCSHHGTGGNGSTAGKSTASGAGTTGGTTTSSTASVAGSTSGSASSSTTAATSSGGSNSSGTAGGSSGLVTCNGGINNNTIFDCNSDPFYSGTAEGCPAAWLGSQLIDFNTCSPICSATVSAVSPQGVTVAGTSQLVDPVYGTFHFCLPPQTTFETTATAPGYPTFIYGEIDGQLGESMPQMGMLSSDSLSAFASFIPGGVDLLGSGALVVWVDDLDNCGTADSRAGWSMSLADEAGNPYPDGGYSTLYIDSAGFPDSTLGATSAYGTMLIYNINPSVAQFPSFHVSTPAGSACQLVNPEIGFTGRVQIGAGLISEQSVFIE